MWYCLIKKVVSKMFGKLKNLFGGDTGITIAAPTAGTVVALESVPDPTFAQGILGPGIAIEPSEGRIVAPADGTVDVMFETGHAVSMTTADGAELLIHVGIDTVQLEGKHYKACCKAGQQVKKGDVLIEFDPAAIKAEGYQIVTPILVCNPDAFTVEPAAGGRITLEGKDITHAATHDIVQRGIVLVPEGRRVLPNLTVLENLRIGAYLREDKDAIEHDIEHVYSLFPRLKERHWQQAGTLSGGEQQMLAVGRALMAKPKVMMMDEPSLGLAPLVVKDIFSIIRRINDDGVTVLLIEQNANAALKIADRGYVLQTGNVTMTGTGMELLNDESIKEAYLGKK